MRTIRSRTPRPRGRVLLGAVLAATALLVSGSAVAAPPSNDNFADAKVIPGLPFSETVGIAEATTEPGEPSQSFGQSRTVWWSFAPSADTLLRVRPRGCCSFLSVFRADAPGFAGLTRLDSSGSSHLGTTYAVAGGATYYFQSGDLYPYGWETATTLPLEEVLPPPNDDLADAAAVSGVPYSDAVPGFSGDFDSGVAVQPDGKIVVVGTANRPGPNQDIVVARYEEDGSLDETFGIGGISAVDFGASIEGAAAVALSQRGKIVVAATSGRRSLQHRLRSRAL